MNDQPTSTVLEKRRLARQTAIGAILLALSTGIVSAGKGVAYDLMGNVSEWIRECGYSCESHLVRGSAWDSHGEELNLEFRDSSIDAGDTRGIRVVREL